MYVKQRLRLNAIFSVVMAMVILAILFLALHRLNETKRRTMIAGDVIAGSLEAITVRNDYLRNNVERAKKQWFAKHEETGRTLREAYATFSAPSDRATIDKLTRNHKSVTKLFSAIVENREKMAIDSKHRELATATEERLLNQLNMRVYEVVIHARQLLASSRATRDAAMRDAFTGVVAIMLLLIGAVCINSRTLNRAVTGRVRTLRDGAVVIGGGHLEHRIDVRGDDEFAELADSFNGMTARLQASYQSLRKENEERKEAEARLQDSLRRTAEYAAELQQAKQAAEAASRTKSQFLANMSHELRTPMTGLLGMLELALHGPMPPEQQENLETALKAGHSLLHILNDILDLTKVESGKLIIEAKPFNLRNCVMETVDMFSPEARRRGLALECSFPEDLPVRIVGDQGRFGQVLTNLVANALKFTEKGGVKIRVTVGEPLPGKSGDLVVRVTDTGIGVPEEKKHLLFKFFSQVDDSNTRGYGGAGLGLAISRGIVERMGGSISFESEEGKGSTFTFTAPCEMANAGVPAGAGDETEGRAALPAPGTGTAGVRMLIAEDDPVIRQLLERMFTMLKFAVEFAEDGEMAVKMWQENDYDLVLMDVQMPKLDGFEATRAIRELERGRERSTPVIAMTAHTMKEDEERCLAAGMDAFLSKPIDFKACLATVHKLLGDRERTG